MTYHSRSRSRSPEHQQQSSRTRHREHYRHRSPHRGTRHHDSVHSRAERHSHNVKRDVLPLDAAPISKHDLRRYRPLLTLYLDVQKRLDIEDLSEDEVKGRWKSFVGKWNRGELAEGWYDPSTFQKALDAERRALLDTAAREDTFHSSRTERHSQADQLDRRQKPMNSDDNETDEDDDRDEYGPSLPHILPQSRSNPQSTQRSGPANPTLQDLRARDEQREEERDAARKQDISDIRSDRKADRRLQREHLDDLTPRAEAGSRERMLENKRLAADANRTFASSAHAGGDIELKDSDIMGDEDSVGDLRRHQKEQARKKNEREIRREEILRARIAEREERVKGLREKENKTMDMLKKIAQARFGGGEDKLEQE